MQERKLANGKFGLPTSFFEFTMVIIVDDWHKSKQNPLHPTKFTSTNNKNPEAVTFDVRCSSHSQPTRPTAAPIHPAYSTDHSLTNRMPAPPVPIQANGLGDENAGVRQQHRGFKPPAAQPGMLNKEMAEAAALKYEKDKKKIRKAVAKLEPENKDKDAGCSCVIM